MLTALFMLAMPLTIITNSYGRVIDRFNAQTEEIRNLKMKIRMLDFRICELEGTIYVDPFKGRGRGEGKFGQWIKRIKDKIYGEEKTRRPSISTVVGKVPTAAELVDPDAEKEGLDGDPDVAGNQGETSTEELLHQMRELLVLRSQDEARAKRIEEAVEKILDIMAVGQPPSS